MKRDMTFLLPDLVQMPISTKVTGKLDVFSFRVTNLSSKRINIIIQSQIIDVLLMTFSIQNMQQK